MLCQSKSFDFYLYIQTSLYFQILNFSLEDKLSTWKTYFVADKRTVDTGCREQDQKRSTPRVCTGL